MLETILTTSIGTVIGFTICYFWYRKVYIALKETDQVELKVETYDGKLKVTTDKGYTFEFPNWVTKFIIKGVLLRKSPTATISFSSDTLEMIKKSIKES